MVEMKDPPEKWLCEECRGVCGAGLTAANPFDPTDVVVGCPTCKAVNTLVGACQFDGCAEPASGGHPGGYGYRYIWTCYKHRPQ